MNNTVNNFVLTGSVKTGKTSSLIEWFSRKNDVYGFACPYMDDVRVLQIIHTGEIEPMELKHITEPDDKICDDIIKVGRFRFSNAAFVKMRNILNERANLNYNWMVIDEIGKLELSGKGLEPELTQYLLNPVKQLKNIIVVRDYLLNEALSKYRLENYLIVQKDFFYRLNDTTVLILAGGESQRMGTNKAFLCYHNKKPQIDYLYEFFKAFFNDVRISARYDAAALAYKKYSVILDHEDCRGPIAGLRAAINEVSDKNILLMAIDYPNICDTDIFRLINESTTHDLDAVCYINKEGIKVPVIAWINKRSFERLKEFISKGGTSLRRFLDSISTKELVPHHYGNLESFDTYDQYIKYSYGSY